MSLHTKVYVVIQAVLIMVYLGVSATLYQHKRDWRNGFQKLKERYRVSTQLAAKEIDALRAGVRAKNDFISQKQGEVSQHKQELDRQNTALDRVSTDLNSLKAAFE